MGLSGRKSSGENKGVDHDKHESRRPALTPLPEWVPLCWGLCFWTWEHLRSLPRLSSLQVHPFRHRLRPLLLSAGEGAAAQRGLRSAQGSGLSGDSSSVLHPQHLNLY